MHRIEENFQTIEQMAIFTGTLVQTTNLVALIFAFVGSSFMIRMFGVKFCLIAFPVLVGSVISYVWVKPELWVIFSAIVTLKGLSYALDRPCKEILYVPTSLDIKFKAKSWIDGFGYRCFFAMGASVNNLFSSTSTLMAGGPIIAVMMCSAWASIAWYLGTRNTTLIQDNTIIE